MTTPTTPRLEPPRSPRPSFNTSTHAILDLLRIGAGLIEDTATRALEPASKQRGDIEPAVTNGNPYTDPTGDTAIQPSRMSLAAARRDYLRFLDRMANELQGKTDQLTRAAERHNGGNHQ